MCGHYNYKPFHAFALLNKTARRRAKPENVANFARTLKRWNIQVMQTEARVRAHHDSLPILCIKAQRMGLINCQKTNRINERLIYRLGLEVQ